MTDGISNVTRRLYYALWPPPNVAAQFLEPATLLQAAVGGRITKMASVHLTLAFLGDVAEQRLPELLAVPAGLATEPFVLEIDHVGVWHHNGIGWAAPSVTPPAMAVLQQRLSDWLEAIGFVMEKRAFAPHVTLVRRSSGKTATVRIDPVRWAVTEFVLVQSIPTGEGMKYEVVERFALEADRAT